MRVDVSPTQSAADAATRHRKLVDAAQQFEAMFLQQMMKSSAPDGENAAGADEAAGAGQSYKDYGSEAVARAIAKAGGVGIARQVVAQVEHVEHVGHAAAINEKTFGTALKSFAKAPIKT